MKLKKLKLTALFISALMGLTACTPAIDNGLTRSPQEHLTVPDASGNTAQNGTAPEGGYPTAAHPGTQRQKKAQQMVRTAQRPDRHRIPLIHLKIPGSPDLARIFLLRQIRFFPP